MPAQAARAFTLIELLVVVAIISILASIALPNYQHSLLKAKATAALAEMKSLSTAIETYQLDHNSYPLDGNDYPVRAEELFDQAWIQHVLTTPIAYISQLPEDLFHTKNTHELDPRTARYFQSRPPYPYVYLSRDNWVIHRGSPRAYSLFSFGPDFDFDNDGKEYGEYLAYNPTNGIVSDGDIFIQAP